MARGMWLSLEENGDLLWRNLVAWWGWICLRCNCTTVWQKKKQLGLFLEISEFLPPFLVLLWSEVGPFSGRVTFQSVSPANDSALLLLRTQESDEGSYTCHISTFPSGNFERKVSLTVESKTPPPPSFFLAIPLHTMGFHDQDLLVWSPLMNWLVVQPINQSRHSQTAIHNEHMRWPGHVRSVFVTHYKPLCLSLTVISPPSNCRTDHWMVWFCISEWLCVGKCLFALLCVSVHSKVCSPGVSEWKCPWMSYDFVLICRLNHWLEPIWSTLKGRSVC